MSFRERSVRRFSNAKHKLQSFSSRAFHMSDEVQTWINRLAFLFVPFYSLFLIEFFQQSTWELRFSACVLNGFVLALLHAFLFFVIRSLKWSSTIQMVSCAAIGYVNYYVLGVSSDPIMAGDIFGLKTALAMPRYKFAFDAKCIAAIGLLLLGIILTRFFDLKIEKGKRRRVHLLRNVVATVISTVFVMSQLSIAVFSLSYSKLNTVQVARQNGFLVNFLRSAGELFYGDDVGYSQGEILEAIQLFIKEKSAEDKSEVEKKVEKKDVKDTETTKGASIAGPPLPMLSKDVEERNASSTKDKRFDQYLMDSIMQQHFSNMLPVPNYEAEAIWNLEKVNDLSTVRLMEGDKADVIAIMNESFADLSVLGDFTTNQEIFPFLSRLSTDTRKGTAHSSVVGGGTANSEFEFLTGNTMAFFPLGSIPYEENIKGDSYSLAQLFKEQGYETTGMHPFWSKSWGRDEIYPLLGFDNCKFDSDFTHQEKIRGYISDDALYDEILMQLDSSNTSDKGQFIFTVSMQNHGDYIQNLDDNFLPGIKLIEVEGVQIRDPETYIFTEEFLNDELPGSLQGLSANKRMEAVENTEEYLSLVRESDRAIGEFLATLKERKKPTMVVFFGDHQPAERAAKVFQMYESSNSEDRRKVPYFIWANYDIEESFNETSALPFLASEALPLANVEMNMWLEFLASVSEEFPIVNDAYYVDTQGELTEHHMNIWSPKKLRQYEILQYNTVHQAGVYPELYQVSD